MDNTNLVDWALGGGYDDEKAVGILLQLCTVQSRGTTTTTDTRIDTIRC